MTKLIQINVGGGRAAQDLAYATANQLKIDIMMISEQYNNEHDRTYSDLGNRAAISVVNNKISIDEIGPEEFGFRWIGVSGKRLYSCYCSPNTGIAAYTDFLSRLELSIRGSTMPVVVSGDFNAHSPLWGSPSEDKRGEQLVDMLAANDLNICNEGNIPTFVRGASGTHIDLTFASTGLMPLVKRWRVLEEESLSLHKYVTYEISSRVTYTTPQTCRGWQLKKLDGQKLQQAIREEIDEEPWNHGSLEEEVESYGAKLVRVADRCMPRRGGSCKRPPAYWWSTEIAELRALCNSIRRMYQRKRQKKSETECSNEAEQYRQCRKKLVTEVKKAKEKCWRELCQEVENDPWGRPYKTIMKKLKRITPIIGSEVTGRVENIIGELFPKNELSSQSYTEAGIETAQTTQDIQVAEVLEALTRLPNGKAPGPDGIANEILKVVVRADPAPITHIFNRCLREAYYPERWKVANLVLIQKAGRPPEDPKSYRPLCLLDTVGKLFEKILVKRLNHYLEETGSLAETQYGFRKRRSTLHAIERLQTTVREANDAGKVVGMLTLDVSNAFNSAPWQCIMGALKRMKVPAYLVHIIRSYLTNRSITYTIGGKDRTFPVERGVPQGSVLGPCLWNVMYNGVLELCLPDNVECIAFADDLAVVATAEHGNFLPEKLEPAFQQISEWMKTNGLTLAEHKTEAIVFTNRWSRNKLEMKCGNVNIVGGKNVKYLGLILDQKLNYIDHANTVHKKATDTIRRLGYILPNLGGAKEWRRRLLAGVAMSQIMYGVKCWESKMASTGWNKLEKLKRRLALMTTCSYSSVSHEAIGVVASMPPMKLKAKERVSRAEREEEAETEMFNKWQEQWSVAEKGRWTYSLIPDLSRWVNRRYGETNFHLTQFITGHGCFGHYLHRIKRRDSDECQLCGSRPDTANHAVLECDAWTTLREDLQNEIGAVINAGNIIDNMLSSKENWRKISSTIEEIMRKREEVERDQERRMD